MVNSQTLLAEKHTAIVKNIAYSIGFEYCGIAKAGFLADEAPRLENWLKNNHQGEMAWMANHFDKRLDPTKLVEGSKSVVSLALNYFPKNGEAGIVDGQKVSRYALGEDYHKVIKRKLKEFFFRLHEEIGKVEGRGFVDSAPVMDKVWAAKAGIGWVAKHSNLIIKQAGSYFFLAELILDLELIPDNPIGDYCGSCRKCIDACPTEAIVEPYKVDGSKCISYFTIELKNAIPEEFAGKMENWVFGCDICQEVCPWNRFSTVTKEQAFSPLSVWEKELVWENISEELFAELFSKSAIKRTGLKGMLRNSQFAKKLKSD